jgi:hypothetical protein
MRKSKCEYSLCSGLHRYPLVGICSRLRHSRLDLYELRPDARTSLPHFSVCQAVGHGRVPCTEEVCAERQHVMRSREVECGKLRIAEASPVGFAQDLIPEDLEYGRGRRAELFKKLRDQDLALAAERTRQKTQSLSIFRRGDCVQSRECFGHSLIP